MTNRTKLQKIIICATLIACFVSLGDVLVSEKMPLSYGRIWLWPIAYLVFCLTVYSPLTRVRQSHSFGLIAITVVQLFPRYVVYPFILANTYSSYTGVQQVSINIDDINNAVYMGMYEIIMFGLFVLIYENSRKRVNKEKDKCDETQYGLVGSNYVYIAYILLSLMVYLIIGRRYNVIQFMTMSSGYAEVTSNIYLTLVKYIVSIALCLCTLMVIRKEKNNYDNKHKTSNVIIALFAAVLFTCVIVGESRSTQIGIGILLCIILIELFPKYKTAIVVSMAISASAVVASITLFRTGSTSIIDSSFKEFADKLQIYCGGPSSIAQSINVFKNNNVDFGTLAFDFLRSCFPLNLLLKDNGYTTSQLYNMHLYNGLYTHGHVVFGASYGYIYLGILGIPLTMCLNGYLIFKANEVYYNTNALEVKYLSGYCMIRLIAATLVNTPSILGAVTQYIGTFGLLILCSRFIRRSNRTFKARG